MHKLTLLASICVVLGIYLLGRKRRAGWVFQFAGSTLSIVHFGFFVYDLSVTMLNIILAGLAILAWLRWGSDEPLMLRFARWRGSHYYIKGVCRGCGVWYSGATKCDWSMTDEQWAEITWKKTAS